MLIIPRNYGRTILIPDVCHGFVLSGINLDVIINEKRYVHALVIYLETKRHTTSRSTVHKSPRHSCVL